MARDPYRSFRIWFYAAAAYNFIWGTAVILFPEYPFRLYGMAQPVYPAIWQSVGMMVQVYALGYYLLARDPERYAALIWIGLLGKTFGPIGFLVSAINGKLPWVFGFTCLTNDVIWWPIFWMFALKYGIEPMRSLWKSTEKPHSDQ